MIKHINLMPFFNDWHSSWIIRLAERVSGKPLIGHKRNVVFSVSRGLMVGIFVATIVLLASVFLNNKTDLISNLSLFGLVFFQGGFFGFLMTLVVTVSDGMMKKIKQNGKGNFLLSSFIFVASTALIVLISFVYFNNYTPSRYFEKAASLSQSCVDGECTPAAIQSDELNYAGKQASNKSAAEDVNGQEQNKFSSDFFENLSKEEFDEHLETTGFKNFDIKSSSKKAYESFGEQSLFPDKKNVDWDIFLLELDEVASDSPQYADIKIRSAFQKEAPFEVVTAILNKGYQLNGSHLVTLAKYLTVDEFKKLENYGVNLSESSSTGANVLVRSLLNKAGPELFDYFLTIDELVLSDDVNVVKEVLKLSSQLNRPIEYTQKLIKMGAPVTAETKEWIENDLRKSNPNYYAIVKSRLSLPQS
jgi:hypothetical protein